MEIAGSARGENVVSQFACQAFSFRLSSLSDLQLFSKFSQLSEKSPDNRADLDGLLTNYAVPLRNVGFFVCEKRLIDLHA